VDAECPGEDERYLHPLADNLPASTLDRELLRSDHDVDDRARHRRKDDAGEAVDELANDADRAVVEAEGRLVDNQHHLGAWLELEHGWRHQVVEQVLAQAGREALLHHEAGCREARQSASGPVAALAAGRRTICRVEDLGLGLDQSHPDAIALGDLRPQRKELLRVASEGVSSYGR
jgi:hypothetical protein